MLVAASLLLVLNCARLTPRGGRACLLEDAEDSESTVVLSATARVGCSALMLSDETGRLMRPDSGTAPYVPF